MSNRISDEYLEIVKGGFTFKNAAKDLAMVKTEHEYLSSLSFDECVMLVEGLDDYAGLTGKETFSNRKGDEE